MKTPAAARVKHYATRQEKVLPLCAKLKRGHYVMKKKECIERVKRWIGSDAGKASRWLIVLCIILIIIGSFDWGNLSEKAAANISSILLGVATNLIGIVITITFVQYFLDKQQEKDERNEEAKRILRQDRLLQVLIKSYTAYYNQLTIARETLNGIPKIDSEHIDLNFAFSDLRALYQDSLLLRDKHSCPAIVSFYESELLLRDYCAMSIRDIDYKYFPKIGELLLNFVRVSTSMDTRSAILDYIPLKMSDGRLWTDYLSELIGDESNNWVELFQAGKLESNIMIPFVNLYEMMKIEGQLIAQYCEKVKTICIT